MLTELALANKLEMIAENLMGLHSDKVKYPYFSSEEGKKELKRRTTQ